MTLTTAKIDLIRDSFARLQPHVETASALFYDRLFKIAPDVRTLFRADMAGQRVGETLARKHSRLVQNHSPQREPRKRIRNVSGYGTVVWKSQSGSGVETDDRPQRRN